MRLVKGSPRARQRNTREVKMAHVGGGNISGAKCRWGGANRTHWRSGQGGFGRPHPPIAGGELAFRPIPGEADLRPHHPHSGPREIRAAKDQRLAGSAQKCFLPLSCVALLIKQFYLCRRSTVSAPPVNTPLIPAPSAPRLHPLTCTPRIPWSRLRVFCTRHAMPHSISRQFCCPGLPSWIATPRKSGDPRHSPTRPPRFPRCRTHRA